MWSQKWLCMDYFAHHCIGPKKINPGGDSNLCIIKTVVLSRKVGTRQSYPAKLFWIA